MTGTGTPVALQDKVTKSPAATFVLAGAVIITGLSPLSVKKVIHIQKIKNIKIIPSYCVKVLNVVGKWQSETSLLYMFLNSVLHAEQCEEHDHSLK